MTPILDRIRENGGEVIRRKWNITVRRGRLSDDALAWIRTNRELLMPEVWPEYDYWNERAAVLEFSAGQTREEAEQNAYDEVIALRESGKCLT